MSFETQRHRGTQRSGGSIMQSYQGASKALGVHLGKREPPPNHPPDKSRCRTPASHQARSVRLRTALSGRKLPGGGLTWHFMPG